MTVFGSKLVCMEGWSTVWMRPFPKNTHIWGFVLWVSLDPRRQNTHAPGAWIEYWLWARTGPSDGAEKVVALRKRWDLGKGEQELPGLLAHA